MLRVLIVILLSANICFAAAPELVEKNLAGKPFCKYLLQVPSNYSPENQYPLFIAVHWFKGTAEQQINEWKFLANKKSYILLAPQFADGFQILKGREDDKLARIVEEVEREYPIDRERVYLIGFSGGAQFAQRFVYKYPYVKAVCILAAGDYEPPPASEAVKRIKFLVAAGQKDERYPNAQRYASFLRGKGFDVVFKGIPLVGHTLHGSIKQAVEQFLNSLP